MRGMQASMFEGSSYLGAKSTTEGGGWGRASDRPDGMRPAETLQQTPLAQTLHLKSQLAACQSDLPGALSTGHAAMTSVTECAPG